MNLFKLNDDSLEKHIKAITKGVIGRNKAMSIKNFVNEIKKAFSNIEGYEVDFDLDQDRQGEYYLTMSISSSNNEIGDYEADVCGFNSDNLDDIINKDSMESVLYDVLEELANHILDSANYTINMLTREVYRK